MISRGVSDRLLAFITRRTRRMSPSMDAHRLYQRKKRRRKKKSRGL